MLHTIIGKAYASMGRALCICLLLLFSACVADPIWPPTPAPPPPPPPGLQQAIDGGRRFLVAQYNPDYGLLQESPSIGQHRYYLSNDNALAAFVFEISGDTDLAQSIGLKLEQYGYENNHFAEVAMGEIIRWPPNHHQDIVVAQLSRDPCDFLNVEEAGPVGDCILQETHTDDLGFFYDWSSFSNLVCMGAVNEYNKGDLAAARWLYRTEVGTFDGYGWADEAWVRRDGVYESLGLAWCLYAGVLIEEPVDKRILTMLMAQQDPESGGFHTHYRAAENRLADANVETTAMTLLALLAVRDGPPIRPPLPAPPEESGQLNP